VKRKVLVDTNVAMDYLADRTPFADSAELVFEAAENGEIELWICALSFTTINFLLRRSYGPAPARKALSKLRTLVHVAPVDERCIDRALASDFTDLEDAVQHESAIHSGADIIITRDEQGFKRSRIPVMSPKAFLRTL
jgi:predicted nucleic acid-binding protein